MATPSHDYQYVRISRVWVFGSVAKGSQNPNDLDIFIELKVIGRFNNNGYIDKRLSHQHGYREIKKSTDYALKWLTKGMKNVSRHVVGHDDVFNKLDCKILIYPRMDFLNMDKLS